MAGKADEQTSQIYMPYYNSFKQREFCKPWVLSLKCSHSFRYHQQLPEMTVILRCIIYMGQL